MLKNASGKIFTFGSYRLGVHGRGTDIDTLCVAPRYVDRTDHFFGILVDILRNRPECTEIVPVPETGVPIIKMMFDGVDIDLAFARIGYREIPDTLKSLESDDLLRNCDRETILSLNGCRVTDKLLELIPNIENFRVTLRCVRLWAKARGIYSNVFGYLGGISWALLTAHICQSYPYLKPNKLLEKFFETYLHWEWGYENPILLREMKSSDVSVPEGIMAWNPAESKKDLMPIITPMFPSFNTSYNVSKTTREVLIREIRKAYSVIQRIQ